MVRARWTPEAADCALFEGGVDIRDGSVVEWVEGASFIDDIDGDALGIGLEINFDLVLVVIVAVVHDIEYELFDNEVDAEEHVGGPGFVDGEGLDGGGDAVEFFTVGLDLDGEVSAQGSGLAPPESQASYVIRLGGVAGKIPDGVKDNRVGLF